MIYNLDDYPVFDGLPVLIFCRQNVVTLLFFNVHALLEKKMQQNMKMIQYMNKWHKMCIN